MAEVTRTPMLGPARRSSSWLPTTWLGWLVLICCLVLGTLVFVEVVNVAFYDPYGESRFLWSFQGALSGIAIGPLSFLMFGTLLVLLFVGLPLAFVTGSLGVVQIGIGAGKYILHSEH